MKKNLDLRISKNTTMLERWFGCPATMLEMTLSHKSLRIMIHGEKYEYGKNLIISCIDPEYICGPVNWEHSRIKIHSTELDKGNDGVLIADRAANVKITSSSFEVAENVKFLKL